jgi:hypothetical protein
MARLNRTVVLSVSIAALLGTAGVARDQQRGAG